MNREQIEKLHRETSMRVAELSRLLRDSPDEGADRDEGVQGHSYVFDKALRFADALSYLLAPSHPLSDDELGSLVGCINDLPIGWRNAGYWDPADADRSGFRVLTRDNVGKPTMQARPVLGIAENSTEVLPWAADTSELIPPDSVTADAIDADLSISVLRVDRARDAHLVLRWWAADEYDDYAGEVPFATPPVATRTRTARIPNKKACCVFSLILNDSGT